MQPLIAIRVVGYCRRPVGAVHEATAIYRSGRWSSGGMAVRGTRAAACDACGRISAQWIAKCIRTRSRRVSQWPKRDRLRRKPECEDRISLGGRSCRPPASSGGRFGAPQGSRARCTRWRHMRGSGQSRDIHYPDSIFIRRRSSSSRPCHEFQPARRQCYRREHSDGRAWVETIGNFAPSIAYGRYSRGPH